jgi:signal transduction histidine kinase
MKVTELIPLSAALINLALALFVFTRGPRRRINQVYLLWGTSVAIWNTGTFFMFRVDDAAAALRWARFLQMGVIFLPVAMFHLCTLVAQVSVRPLLWGIYLWHLVLAATNFTRFFIADVRYAGYAYYSVAGPGFWIFSGGYFLLAVAILVILFRSQNRFGPMHRARIRPLLWANGTLILFGSNDILPIVGIWQYPVIEVPIFPFGSLAAIFYSLMVCSSVLQHQLLDIHVTLGRAAARLVRLMFFFLVGLCLLLLLAAVAPEQFTLFTFFGSLGVLVTSAVVASIFFPRLFGDGSDALERRILGDRFEYHDKIRGFIESMPWYADPEALLHDFEELLLKTIRMRSYAILLLDETTRHFGLFRSFPEQVPTTYPDLHAASSVAQFFQAKKVEYLALPEETALAGATPLEQAVRRQFKKFDAEFCLPFYAGDDLFGFLLIGPKLSGEPYTPHDLQLFSSLVHNLSLNLNQVRLKQQIWAQQEMELMGRMSRGLAHDLNNLITPVSTFLQLAAASATSADPAGELLPIALRNVDTIRAYINEALFFSQNQVPQFRPERLDLLVCKGVELAEAKLRRKDGLKIVVHDLPETCIEMDAVLILRLINNLLSNAIDASPPGSQIELDLQRLARTEPNRDWYRLRVRDHGEGISPENLKRVMTPYFTTKDHGDEGRGFGLGLAICRKIVHLHGGNLKIESERHRGTVVLVDLPSRPINSAPARVKVPA